MSNDYDRKDHFYKLAKEQGYRSRAAFKLLELDKSYSLFKPGMHVLDLGSWPGGWLQVAAQKIGLKGRLVGIDLVQLEGIGQANVHTICGDIRDESSFSAISEYCPDKFDLLISDMSPKLSGIKEADTAGATACAELALWTAQRTLKTGGNFVVKVFKNGETEQFVKSTRALFNKLVRTELDSTRKTSNEFYILGFGLR